MFMPVGTLGNVKAIELKDLNKRGYGLILGNTYHLFLRPGLEIIEEVGSLHDFIHWKQAILTDSGGYQVMSLHKLRKIQDEGVLFQSHLDGTKHLFTPEKVVDIQTSLRSDIQMVLDVCVPPGISHEETSHAMKQTHRWARRARDAFESKRNKTQSDWPLHQFGIIQGGFYADLRSESSEHIQSIPFEGIAIGGLAVGESFAEYAKQLEYLAPLLDSTRIHYAMGIGSPDFILEAVRNGVDIFDSVYPTRCARNGRLLTLTEGTINIKNARFAHDFRILPTFYAEEQGYTYSYLHHLFRAKEILATMIASQINLRFMHQFCAEIRSSIESDEFEDYYLRMNTLFARK